MKFFIGGMAWCIALLVFNAASANDCKVLVVVGMKDEKEIVIGKMDNHKQIEVVVGTANAEILRERLQKTDFGNIRAVFSFGVAGSLDPDLAPGDLLFSEQVFSQIHDANHNAAEISWLVDANLLLSTSLHASKAKLEFRKGIFLGSDTEARDQAVDVVTHLYEATGAHIIDNETHIAAQFASEHNLPFLSVRAVSDSVHRPLPPAALLPLDPEDGSPDGAAIAKSLLLNPLQIPALIRAAFNYQKALAALQAFNDQVGFEKPAPNNHQACLKGKNFSAAD